MSKVGRQNSGLVDVRAMAAAATGFGGGVATRVTRASSTSTAKTTQQQQAAGKSSIVSTIEVNMETSTYEAAAAASVGAHCKPNAPPPPISMAAAAAAAAAAAVKKKRLALGNLSNADLPSSNSNAPAGSVGQSSNNNNNPPVAPKDAKKYRFSGANIVNIAMPSFGQKKTDQATAAKKAVKASSKENLHQLHVPAVRKTSGLSKKPSLMTAADVTAAKNNKATAAVDSTLLSKASSVSKSENDIKRQVDSLTLAAEVSSSSSTMSLITSLPPTQPSSSSTTTTTRTSAASATLQQQQQQPRVMTPDLIAGWEDIDAGDSSDEFASADYVASIFKYYREREDVFVVRDYLNTSVTNITRQMRVLLIDWMVEVQQQLEFNHEVLYLSVKLLDLYLTRQLVDKERLQLLAAACMFIACKFEERMPPVIEDFILVSDNAYARREMIMMEMEILKMVKFDLGAPLSYTFLRRYAKCIRADMKFLTLARYILELSLQDYSFAPERDSLKACAALYLAMKMAASYEASAANLHDQAAYQPFVSTSNLNSTDWNATLIHYTNSFVHDFSHLIRQMNSLVKNAPNNKYKTIFRKYSHPVFFEVAKVPALSDYQVDFITNSSNEMVH